MHYYCPRSYDKNFMLRATLCAWAVVSLRAGLPAALGREAEQESENSVLNFFHRQFGKPNSEPHLNHVHKDSLISPVIFHREKSKQEEINVGTGVFEQFPPNFVSRTEGAAVVLKSSPRKKTTINHPKTQSFVKITFSSPQLIRRSKRKRFKIINASAAPKNELSWNELETLTANDRRPGPPQPELTNLFDREEHSSVGLLQTVLRQQLPLEHYAGNSLFGSAPTTQLYQPEVGGSCFTSLGEPGTCVPLEDCPQLRPLVQQLYVKNAAILLVQQLCRLGETKYFVCCEYPAFQNPPYAVGRPNAVLPQFQKSVYSAPLPGEGECGAVGPQPGDEDGRHRELDPHEWPWLVAVGRTQGREAFNVQCSGNLFTRRHVLTAASCFYLQEIRQPSMVRVGEHDVSVKEGSSHQDYLIVGRNDPSWVLYFNQENLMVLTLDRDVVFSAQVQPICLPPPDISVPEVGTEVATAGWKRFRSSGNASEAAGASGPLLARLDVVSLRECQTAYSDLETNFFLVDYRNICVMEDEKDPLCCAEVGAPVVRQRDDGAYELVGVVTVPSFAALYLPTVATRISAYSKWLEFVVGV